MKKLLVVAFLILFGCGPAISYDMQNSWREVDEATDEVQAAQPLPDSVLIPPGGTTGQILMKKSNTDGDTYWSDPPAGGGCDPTVDYVGGGTVVVGTEALVNTGQAIIQLYTPTCAGTIDEFVGIFQVSGTSSVVMFAYLDDGDEIPNAADTLVDYGAVTFSGVTGEVRVAGTTGDPFDPANKYWVGLVNNLDNSFRLHFEASGPDVYASGGNGDWYPTPPPTLDDTWTLNSSWQNIGVFGTLQ